jgi:tetratricopeptide (TPR) repeat protein
LSKIAFRLLFLVEKISKLSLLALIDSRHFSSPALLQIRELIVASTEVIGGQMAAFYRGARRLIVCGFVIFFLGANLSAQEEAPAGDLAQAPTGELEKQAAFMVGAQKFPEAIPLLTELVSRLGESKDPQLQAKVEGFRYFLGLGHVFNNDWDASALAFEAFLKAHPKSNRYRKVLELHADTLVQSKQYAAAAEQYKKLLELKLPETENFSIMEKLASCYMRDQKWTEAIPVLLTMWQKSWTLEQREQSVVWLAQSYIESDQGAKVVELLPDMLTKAPKARLSIDFNMALLNGGDKMFSA